MSTFSIGDLLRGAKIKRTSAQQGEKEFLQLLKQAKYMRLNDLKLSDLSNLETYIPNVEHVHLFSNQIKEIPDSLLKLENLKSLYLQKNLISEIPKNFNTQATRLLTLHLENNEIAHFSGNPPPLEELHISHQHCSSLTSPLTFSSQALIALSGSLRILDISNNGIKILKDFEVLRNLSVFVCEDNQVEDIQEVLAVVKRNPRLIEIAMNRNPITSTGVKKKYFRDAVLQFGGSLELVNGVSVEVNEKLVIKEIAKRKKGLIVTVN
jgi:Leucine-rich repeat (LRR) protein